MGIKHSCDAASRHVRCRHTSAKDPEKSPGSRFLFIFLPVIQNGSGSFCSDLYDTVAKKLSRKPGCNENYDSEWLTRRSIAEARLRCMNSVTLPKQCFISDDQLKSHKSEQENKVIQEKQDRINTSRSKWNESCQHVYRTNGSDSLRKEYEKLKDNEHFADTDDSEKVKRAHTRQESTNLRRETRKLMAKEYAEVYMSEQLASIDACEKERDHTSNEEGTYDVCNEYRDFTKDKYGENESSCTTLLENGCCSKAEEKHKLNVSHGVHGTGFERTREKLMQKKDENVSTTVLLAENDKFEEDMITHTKLNNYVSGVERKEQVKKVSTKMKKKLDRPTSYTSSKAMAKSCLRLFALLVMISLVNTTSLATRTNDESTQQISSYDLLSTDVCSRTNFDRSQSCQLSGYQLKDTIRHCGFQELCKKGEKARCVNTLQGGMAHICSPENLSCLAGIWRKAWIDTDDPDVVRVKEENCPYGTFQPYESNCFDACKATHLDTSALPEKYILFSEGDASSPTYVYCNYKKGHFNLDYKTFLNYDEDSEHNPYFCRHVDEFDTICTEKKYPLPNGTCVSECMPGECRDDHDEFICKRNCSYKASDKDDDGKNVKHQEDVDECHENDDICKNGVCQNTHGSYICNCSEGFMMDQKTGECIEKGKSRDKPSDMKDITIILLSSIIPPFCIVIGGLVIFVLLKRRRCSNVPADDYTLTTSSDGISPSSSSIDSASEKNTSVHEKLHERPDMLTVDERTENSKKEKDSEHDTAVLQLTFEEGKVSELVCQDDVTTPLLHEETDLDLTETESQTKRKGFDGKCAVKTNTEVLKKNERMVGFEGEGLKKDVDDTFTPSVMASLTSSTESCGALIFNGNLAGTVFRVGSKYVMTAFHVIHSILIDLRGIRDYNFDCINNCHGIFVNFNESVCGLQCSTFRIKVAYYNEAIEVAVLELVDIIENENTFVPKPLFVWPYDACLLSKKGISLAGYGHKNSPYKKHWEPCRVLTDHQREEKFQAAHAWLQGNRQDLINDIQINGKDHTSVERGYLGYDNENTIKFDCFMEKGLSGGPIFTNEANSVKVIGMVVGGRPELYYNLSPRAQVSFPNKYRFEFGVKMSLIFDTILSENPVLARDIFPMEI